MCPSAYCTGRSTVIIVIDYYCHCHCHCHCHLDACDVYTWGASPKGTLGHGEEIEELVPRVVEALLGRDVRTVSCGTEHTLAVSGSYDLFLLKYISSIANQICLFIDSDIGSQIRWLRVIPICYMVLKMFLLF